MRPSLKEKLNKFQKENNRTFPLPENFVNDFSLLFFTPEIKGILDYLKTEFKGKFRNETTVVSDRTLKHWENLKIIPANRDVKRGWRSYGYMDQLWTRIIIDLRKLGYPLENIKSIRDNYLTMLSEDVDCSYPLLALFFVYSNHYKDDVYFIVFSDGSCELSLREAYIKTLAEAEYDIPNHININVTIIMSEIENYFPENNPLRVFGTHNLNPQEDKILKALRIPNYLEIKVSRVRDQKFLETTKEISLTNETLQSSLHKIHFGEFKGKKKDGNIITAQITNKEKL